jgi:hypothetical protein
VNTRKQVDLKSKTFFGNLFSLIFKQFVKSI